jgi:hypothetical protein
MAEKHGTTSGINVRWHEILDFVLEQDCHKWYSRELGWCYIIGRDGKRYEITRETTYSEAVDLINKIR